ncbi:hypothetical protein CRM22_009256 [Opisthorchis felineus]|uniref:Uncharacterized protein n=1 Tax=Opisthorchis felineus TaxID=147828 RepID=A0A4S2L7L3_OPIFE|nr:hypothetical protein CRM22_009256 [Opisthorchis felineus]
MMVGRLSRLLGIRPRFLFAGRSHRFFSSHAPTSGLPTDLNSVVLLGTVTTVVVHEKVDKRYAVIYLGTRESYKVQNGYAAKYSSHRVHVFDDNLFLTVCNMTKGDRVCVHGSLASFLTSGSSGNPPMWMSCIIARTICPYSNPAEDSEVIVSDDPSIYNKLETALDEDPSWSSSSSTPLQSQ